MTMPVTTTPSPVPSIGQYVDHEPHEAEQQIDADDRGEDPLAANPAASRIARAVPIVGGPVLDRSAVGGGHPRIFLQRGRSPSAAGQMLEPMKPHRAPSPLAWARIVRRSR